MVKDTRFFLDYTSRAYGSHVLNSSMSYFRRKRMNPRRGEGGKISRFRDIKPYRFDEGQGGGGG